jgi:transcriptional regulator with XRE-family HTH domain
MQVLFSALPYDADMSKAASRLRHFREKAGLSLRELARQIGEQPSNVSYWERSGGLPRADLLMPIASSLGVSVEELLGKTKPRRAPVAGGRLGQLVEKVSSLPRRQQEKVIDMFETVLVGQQTKAASH